VFNQLGDLSGCVLTLGNVHSADGWHAVLEPVIARYRGTVSGFYFRGDAAFANPEIYEFIEAGGIGYTIRLPAIAVLQDRIGYLLKRPVGRPPLEVAPLLRQLQPTRRRVGRNRDVSCQVEWHPGELYPRVGFIVTNLSRPASASLRSTTSAATCEQWIKEGKGAIKWTRCHAVLSPQRPSAFSSTRSPTTLATSCARWQCRRQQSRGR